MFWDIFTKVKNLFQNSSWSTTLLLIQVLICVRLKGVCPIWEVMRSGLFLFSQIFPGWSQDWLLACKMLRWNCGLRSWGMWYSPSAPPWWDIHGVLCVLLWSSSQEMDLLNHIQRRTMKIIRNTSPLRKRPRVVVVQTTEGSRHTILWPLKT